MKKNHKEKVKIEDFYFGSGPISNLYRWLVGFLADSAIAERINRRDFNRISDGRSSINILDEDYYLIYYKGDEPSSRESISLNELKTGASENDNDIKVGILIWCAAFIMLISIIPHFYEIVRPIISNYSNFELNRVCLIVGYVASLTMAIFLRTLMLLRNLNIMFKDTNNKWELAVADFLQEATKVKFQGIRNCLLALRRFIKWRRASNLLIIAVIFTLSFSVYSSLALKGHFDLFLVAMLIPPIIMLVLHLLAFRVFVKLHTDYRDPTVQLCVMVAELHARFVNRTFIGSSSR